MSERGLKFQPPIDSPMLVRVSPAGVRLKFYHRKQGGVVHGYSLNFEQWDQIVELVMGARPRQQGVFFVGFNDETLRLHNIGHERVQPLSPD